tara:strand:- start:236 stop:1006 length:771 start_codon:yes stop_codon:yes gene_type:complete
MKKLMTEWRGYLEESNNTKPTPTFDKVMDSVFRRVAPNMVRHVLEQEINEDMEEFSAGAIEGRWEKQRDWAGEDPTPEDFGYSKKSLDYRVGYTWGWNNADKWKGDSLPSQARKEAIEDQIKEYEDKITDEMVVAALRGANEKFNPIKLLGKAWDTIRTAGKKEGYKGVIKKGLPIGMAVVVGESLDNVLIPLAFYKLTGIPIPPLPIGVSEIIMPLILNIVGGEIEAEEIADEIGWYEEEFGEVPSLGTRKKTKE